ncbi:hypothetical protein [Spirosoma sp. KNUC1025]|uniref:hypothetical protein n=1 Tax=Spirosoma sp. KNUC1025 TaxID=2894082 RepID=UPI00386B24FC|nr:hypothetical protein LN737_04890 [Spirosoma sp. KNUC1025]
MKKTLLYLSITLLLAGLFWACKDTNSGFSPGETDARITGTWRLYERHYPKDSIFFVYSFIKDSVLNKDSVYVPKIDTIRTSRDTSFYTTQRYTGAQAQTLTFDASGTLTGNGTEMTYYAPIKYYSIDKTYPDSLFIKFFINTNRANVPFQQGLEFRQDTLVLKPLCSQPCYSKLLRVR